MKDLTADESRVAWTDEQVADLLDSAQEHLVNKQPDRAIAIWQQLISAGGDDGDWARVAYVDYLFHCQRDDDARAELAQLLVGGRVFEGPWLQTAELLEELGKLWSALFWYSAAVRCLSDDKVDDTDLPYWAHKLRAGRRRLRWAMEIPLDDEDLRAPIDEDEDEEKEGMVRELLIDPVVIDGRLQFWDRDDFEKTHRLCSRSKLQDAETSYFRHVESVARAAEGARRITLVPRTFQSWVRLLDIAQDARQLADVVLLTSRYDEGRSIKWPPGRNQPCWCGSGTKYKKCCAANVAAA